METGTLRNLKVKLIKELPFFPNDKATLLELESQRLSDVLIHYLHWKTRLVPARSRSIQIAPEVTADKRWKNVKAGVNGLLNKVKQRDELTPYLSDRVHRYGYTPTERIRNGEVGSWEDKDQLLNTMGFHHFHLNMNIQATGLAERTNELLLAHVTRDKFHAIGIFDHSIFDHATIDGRLNPERSRMYKLHDKHTTFGMPSGSFYLSSSITTSGHPMQIIQLADYYAKIVFANDAKLENRDFANEQYALTTTPSPKNFKFEWHINGLDLGLFDRKNNCLFILHQGPI
jgi:hypothetical protein